jgi:hypothetical protein
MRVGDVYTYRHLASKHKVRLVSDEEFTTKGFDEHFLRQYNKFAPDFIPVYDTYSRIYKMVSRAFLKQYGTQENTCES